MVVLSGPGVYVDERPPSTRTIMGVATSVTAFVGDTERGPLDTPVRVTSMAEYFRVFGKTLGSNRPLADCVGHYFANGGGVAIVVRVERSGAGGKAPAKAKATLVKGIDLEAIGPGEWASGDASGGSWLKVLLEDRADVGTTDVRFTLRVRLLSTNPDGDQVVVQEEVHPNLIAIDKGDPDHWRTRLESSRLVRGKDGTIPKPATVIVGEATFTGGADGGAPGSADMDPGDLVPATATTGINALKALPFPRFNLLSLPDLDVQSGPGGAVVSTAAAFCAEEYAIYLVDAVRNTADADKFLGTPTAPVTNAHAAIYFPRLNITDTGPSGVPRTQQFPNSGAVAGIVARTDATRGVWKAPAGIDAGIVGISGLEVPIGDDASGTLNKLGVNALRVFDSTGPVVWGARTGRGSDALASEHKYLPVRRLTDHIAVSLKIGTLWAVFEPNDPDLWATLRASVKGFMRGLFRAGAFQQSMSKAEGDSFFVICDDTNNPQDEIDRGIVNVTVGFAPLKPAEFVVLTITQISRLEA